MWSGFRIDQGAKARQVSRARMSGHHGSARADYPGQLPRSNRTEHIQGYIDRSVLYWQVSGAGHRIPAGRVRPSGESHRSLSDIDTKYRLRRDSPGVIPLTTTHIEHDARIVGCDSLSDGSSEHVIGTGG